MAVAAAAGRRWLPWLGQGEVAVSATGAAAVAACGRATTAVAAKAAVGPLP